MFDRNSLSLISAVKMAVCLALLLLCSPLGVFAQGDPLHIWAGKLDAAGAKSWVDAHLAKEHAYEEQILAVKGPRTLENTLRPYDNAVNEINTAAGEAYLMYSLASQKEVRDAAQVLAQRASEVGSALGLNQDIYRALVAVDLSKADPATHYYMQRTLLEYRLAGVDKDAATRAEIKKKIDHVTELSLQFSRNVQEKVNHVTVKDKAELAGLPDDFVAAHPAGTDGSIDLTTNETDYQPVMTYATNEDLRKRFYLAYDTRAYPVNKQVLQDILQTRYELAKMLGYPTFADLNVADQMMGSVANLKTFLSDLNNASQSAAQREYQTELAFARQKQPGLEAIPAYGAQYWEELYDRSNFHFDSQEVRPYFPFDRVQQGILDTASKLFHVEFHPVKDAVVWDPSVSTFDVFDGGKRAGRIYLDMHPREGKDKWFSSAGVVPGIKGKQLPEAALICNFSGGKAGDPGLMQYEEVVTFFHEFGHLMHQILGGQQDWAGVSGITTETDFSEAPSQMLEQFFRDAGILRSFAKHYQTGEPLPEDLIARMKRASAFGRGSWTQHQLFYSTFSLDIHDRAPEAVDLDELLRTDYTRFYPYKFVDGNHFYAAFTHLTGYASNYYTYAIDKVIALDFFSQFDQKDLLGGEAAMRYRKAVLEPGGSKPGSELIRGFLGRPQNLDAYKVWVNEEFTDSETKR
jgi:Zn-dependent oligopeptidase